LYGPDNKIDISMTQDRSPYDNAIAVGKAYCCNHLNQITKILTQCFWRAVFFTTDLRE
jgi:hypothetical protein